MVQGGRVATRRSWMLLAGSMMLGACGAPNVEMSQGESYPKIAAKWDSATIQVCWESPTSAFPTEKSWVRAKVEGQYETKTKIRLEGWGPCSALSPGIHVTVNDNVGANPHTNGLGKGLDGVKNGMELNFTFNNWSKSCKSNRQHCIESIAVHEFGHMIGLAHEHNRPDTPTTCSESRQGTNGDTEVGDWDVNSVMNYCNPVYNNGGNLSAGDIQGIASMYGARED